MPHCWRMFEEGSKRLESSEEITVGKSRLKRSRWNNYPMYYIIIYSKFLGHPREASWFQHSGFSSSSFLPPWEKARRQGQEWKVSVSVCGKARGLKKYQVAFEGVVGLTCKGLQRLDMTWYALNKPEIFQDVKLRHFLVHFAIWCLDMLTDAMWSSLSLFLTFNEGNELFLAEGHMQVTVLETYRFKSSGNLSNIQKHAKVHENIPRTSLNISKEIFSDF